MWALVQSLRFVLLYSSDTSSLLRADVFVGHIFAPIFSSRTLLSTLGTAVLIALGIDGTCCWELPLWGVAFRISFYALQGDQHRTL